MFTAASVMNRVCACPGTSMTKTWLMRRPGPQSSFPLHHFRQQLIRMQASLHQQLGLAGTDELDSLLGGGLAVRHVDDLDLTEVERKHLRHRGDLALGTDENGSDQPGLARLDRPFEGGFVARIRHCGRERRRLFAAAMRRSYFSWRRNADADEFSFMARSFPRQRLAGRRRRSRPSLGLQLKIARMGTRLGSGSRAASSRRSLSRARRYRDLGAPSSARTSPRSRRDALSRPRFPRRRLRSACAEAAMREASSGSRASIAGIASTARRSSSISVKN